MAQLQHGYTAGLRLVLLFASDEAAANHRLRTELDPQLRAVQREVSSVVSDSESIELYCCPVRPVPSRPSLPMVLFTIAVGGGCLKIR